MKESIQKIPYWVINFISLVSGIITILSGISGVFSFIYVSIMSDDMDKIEYNRGILFFALTCLALCVVIFLLMLKFRNLLMLTRKSMTKNYYNFLRNFRNYYFKLIAEYKQEGATESMRIRNVDNITKTFLTTALDYICEIIGNSAGEEVCACIKVIENDYTEECIIDINEAKVRTFCRSSNTSTERIANDTIQGRLSSVKIVENTDFYEILSGASSSGVYQADLKEYDNYLRTIGKTYKNTTRKYWEYYKGTIVVPIRVANEHLYFNNLNSDYNVIGFLCVDTLSTNVFRKNDKEFYMNIVKAFAAEIYVILNKYKFYLKKIKGDKKYV